MSNKWIEEELEPGLRVNYRLSKLLNTKQSKWQTVDLVDLEPFGRTLLIDGLIQSCQCDEFVYHECLVHPALLAHPCPKSVYIGGGGEGSTARECLRHKTVERVVMVDIDEDVVAFCKEHLNENAAAFADKRLELIIDDAKAVLEKEGKFDVIIMDLDDPLEGGPCYQLYTTEFYEMLKTHLNPGGIFVTQAGAAGVKQHRLVWSPINSTLRAVFKSVTPFNQAVYSFLDEWGFHMASDDPALVVPLESAEVMHDLSLHGSHSLVAQLDRRIAERIDGELQFLDGISYPGIFALSKVHRATLAKETMVMSREKGTHAFMHSQGLCIAKK